MNPNDSIDAAGYTPISITPPEPTFAASPIFIAGCDFAATDSEVTLRESKDGSKPFLLVGTDSTGSQSALGLYRKIGIIPSNPLHIGVDFGSDESQTIFNEIDRNSLEINRFKLATLTIPDYPMKSSQERRRERRRNERKNKKTT